MSASIAVLLLMLVPLEIKQLLIHWVQDLSLLEDKSDSIEVVIHHVDYDFQSKSLAEKNKAETTARTSITLPLSKIGHFVIFAVYTFFILAIHKMLKIRQLIFISGFAGLMRVLTNISSNLENEYILKVHYASYGNFFFLIIIPCSCYSILSFKF